MIKLTQNLHFDIINEDDNFEGRPESFEGASFLCSEEVK